MVTVGLLQLCLPALANAASSILHRFTLTPLLHPVLEDWYEADDASASERIGLKLQVRTQNAYV
jgi:hypothetical protein